MLCDVLEINAEPRKLKCHTSYSLMLVNAVFVFGCTQATLEGEGGEGERGRGEGERGEGRRRGEGERGEGRGEGRGKGERGGGRGERGGREGEGREGGREEGRGRMGRASKGSVSRYLLPNPANLSPFHEIKIRNFFRLPVKADKIV